MSRLSHINIVMESTFDLKEGKAVVRGAIADLPFKIVDINSDPVDIEISNGLGKDDFAEQFAFSAPTSEFFPIENTSDLYSKVLIPLQNAFEQILADRTSFLLELEKKASEVSSGEAS